MSQCQGMFQKKKTVSRQVLNLHRKETDFDSVKITTWLGPVRMSLRGNHRESISRCVPIEKSYHSAGFKPTRHKGNSFRFCYGNHLTKTSSDASLSNPYMSEYLGVFRQAKKLIAGRFLTFAVQEKQILILLR
jgi:hypothetical protein